MHSLPYEQRASSRPIDSLLQGFALRVARGRRGRGGFTWAITFGTGWNFSLVAVLVGYMVGGAVKTGSGEGGGRFYQFLASVSTYSALVGMFIPELWQALGSSSKKGKEAENRIEKEIRQEVKTEPSRKANAKLAENSAPRKAEARPDAAASKPALTKRRPRAGPPCGDVKGRPEDAGQLASAHGCVSRPLPARHAAVDAHAADRSDLCRSVVRRNPLTDFAFHLRHRSLASVDNDEGR